MRARLRITFAASAVLVACAVQATPFILIVQQKVPKSYNSDFNVPIDSHLSMQLDDDGRVIPIIWSLTDPIFRAAVNDKVISNSAPSPTVEQALQGAKALKSEYVMIVKAWRKLKEVISEAEIYRNGKVVWTDKKATSVQSGDDVDNDSSALSIANTWTLKLAQSLFKDYPSKRRDTPTLDPGQQGPDVRVVAPVKVDNKWLAEQAAKMSKSGDRTGLLLLLRDAVDAEPFDIERRRMLIDYLMVEGEVDAAGVEAKRASNLIPDSSEFHVLSARAYLRVNDFATAQSELNEALARDPNGFETRMLCGDLALMKGDAKTALEHYSVAIAIKEFPELNFKRGLAYGLLGEDDKAKADITKAYASSATPMEAASRYQFAIQALDSRFVELTPNIDKAIQKANLSLSGGKEACAAALKPAMGFDSLLNLLKVPEKHTTSNNTRILASSLLAQAIGQVDEAIRTLNPSWLSDARMNFGEAIRQYNAAKKAYIAELEATK